MHERRDVPRTLRPTRAGPRAHHRPQRQRPVRHDAVGRRREQQLTREPLCARCGKVAEIAHHLLGIENDPYHRQLQSLCTSCHSALHRNGGAAPANRAPRVVPPPPPPMPPPPPINGARKLTTGFVSESCDSSYPSSLEHPSTTFGLAPDAVSTPGRGALTEWSLDRQHRRARLDRAGERPAAGAAGRSGAPARGGTALALRGVLSPRSIYLGSQLARRIIPRREFLEATLQTVRFLRRPIPGGGWVHRGRCASHRRMRNCGRPRPAPLQAAIKSGLPARNPARFTPKRRGDPFLGSRALARGPARDGAAA